MRQLSFDHPNFLSDISFAPADVLDRLKFGVIGFDAETAVTRYSAFEARASGLSPQNVLGQPLFRLVAPSMNNVLVVKRFEDAARSGESLDVIIDYVLTLRTRPVKVKLRLLAGTDQDTRYVLVQRAP